MVELTIFPFLFNCISPTSHPSKVFFDEVKCIILVSARNTTNLSSQKYAVYIHTVKMGTMVFLDGVCLLDD
jgi:hypothetical protein